MLGIVEPAVIVGRYRDRAVAELRLARQELNAVRYVDRALAELEAQRLSKASGKG